MIHVQGISSRSGVAITSGISSTNKLIQSYPLSTITVYNTGTLVLASIFTDPEGQTIKANPFTSNTDASFSFYVAPGRYDLRFSGTGITAPFTLSDIFVGVPGETPAIIYSSLLEAVTEIGSTPTNLVISTASFPSGGSCIVPETLILEFRGAGTLLRQGSDVVNVKSDTSNWPLRQLFLGTGTITFDDSTSVAYTTPVWETTNTNPGTTDMGDAIRAAVTEADSNGSPLMIPAGEYAYTEAPNLGVAGLTTQCQGNVVFKHTGTGNILDVRHSSGGEIRDVRVLGFLQVYGNELSGTEGVVIEGLGGQSRIEMNGRGAPVAMFTNKWSVCAEFDLQASISVPGGWLGPVPTIGLHNTSGAADPTDNRYRVIMEGFPGIGVKNEHTSGCKFMGTLESLGLGATEDDDSRRNSYEGIDFEDNSHFGGPNISAATTANPVVFTGAVITTASNAATVVFTAPNHGMPLASAVPVKVVLSGGTGGWAGVNGTWVATPTDANHFTIPVNSSGFGAYGVQNVLISHGMTTGDRITISGGTGNWTAINGRWSVLVTAVNKFSIAVNSTTFGAINAGVNYDRNGDVILHGASALFTNCIMLSLAGANLDCVEAQGSTVLNGYVRSAYLDALSADTSFDGVQFDDSLGITGTGSHRRVACVKVNGSSVVTGRYSDLPATRLFTVQPTFFAVTASATLTAAQLLMIAGTATPGGAGRVYTLPTGSSMEAGIPPTFSNEGFVWSLINISGADSVAIAANADHTFSGNAGALTIAAATTATFRSYKVAASTWVTFRL